MLKENQDFRYVEIDKNLNTQDTTVIVSALNDLDQLLLELTDRALINTMILRLIRIMSNVHQHYIKCKAMFVLARHPSLICSAINKQQVINSITHQLQSHDKLTKLIYLRLIQHLAVMFKDQLSTYHQLMSRLTQNDPKVVFEAYKCLRNILRQSHNLSTVFCNNINSIVRSFNISIVVRLCLHLNINNKYYIDLVSSLWPYVKQHPGASKNYMKLISIASLCNLHAAMFYLNQVHNILNPSQQLVQAIRQQYPFIPCPIHHVPTQPPEQLTMLHDYLFKKHNNNTLSQADIQHVDTIIRSNIHQCRSQMLLLLCYYSTTCYDTLIAQQFSECTNQRLLNILIVLAYPVSALNIIHSLLNTDREYTKIIQKMYICQTLQQHNNITLVKTSPFIKALKDYCHLIDHHDIQSLYSMMEVSDDYTKMLLHVAQLYLQQCDDPAVYRRVMQRHVPMHRLCKLSIKELVLAAVYFPKHILLPK